MVFFKRVFPMKVLRVIGYLVFIFLAGCLTQTPAKKVKVTRTIESFNSITNETDLDIRVNTQQRKPTVVLIGDFNSIAKLSTIAQNHMLTISKRGYAQISNVRIIVNLPHELHAVNNKHKGGIYGSLLKTHNLKLYSHGGPINLRGNLKISRLNSHGDGALRLRGVTTEDDFVFNSHGDGSIDMAGPYIGMAQLNHYGNGNVRISGLQSDNLIIKNKGNGNLDLIGDVGLDRIVHHSGSHINIHGLRSNDLNIKASGNGKINLTGQITLDRIEYSGGDDLTIHGIHNHRLKVNSHGTGNVLLTGRLGVYEINHSGAGNLTLRGIRSLGLQVNSTGRGDINLHGLMNLQTLTHNGSGHINVDRIQSRNVHVRGSGPGHVELHGDAVNIHAVLDGRIDFDASQVKVARAIINTTDKAVAKVYPMKILNALATRSSNVYYYNHPKFIADYSRHNASVIFAGGSEFCTSDPCHTVKSITG